MPGALLTDLYELNMAASYLRRGMHAEATFSLFVRDLPPSRGFLVAAGIDDCLDWLEQFSFTAEDLGYLSTIGFDAAALDAFGAMRFTGDVWAVPEGTVVLAGEPLLEVTGPIAEAQLVETYLLNQVSYQTTIASKAARCRIAAGDGLQLVDFAFRRTHGIEAAMTVAKVSAMAGFEGTSNVEAARRFALTPGGTMAHSYIEAFPTEREAFTAFATDLPHRTTFLVDTYDTLRGVEDAIGVVRDLGLQQRASIRLDSGDLLALSTAARAMLDEAGLPDVRIFVSGGLDERDVARLLASGAPIDAAGIGTRMGVSADAPQVDGVYKLVAYDGRGVAKLSSGKATLPGAKQVFRSDGMRDLIAMRDEPARPGTVALLTAAMAGGRRARARASLAEAAARCTRDLASLPPGARDLDAPVPPVATISPRLRAFTDEVHAAARRRLG
ncbi:MAG TPA: nicotinate phosphoribosyltransferase [Acidimicrobiales bacterium]|nr:nicotinate phosphoribosyltransferase [Acidimicrobiales bacterium]